MPSGITSASLAEMANDVGVLSRLVGGSRLAFGLSRGGVGFNPNRETRDPEFDGRRHRIVGATRVIMWDAEFTGTWVQIGATTLSEFEPGAVVAGDITTPATAAAAFAVGDEMEAPWITFKRKDGSFFSICGYYGIFSEYEVSGEDQNEVEVEGTIKLGVDPDMTDYDSEMAPYYFREDATNPIVAS